MKNINNEWYIQDNRSSSKDLARMGWENYLNNEETVFVRNGVLVVKAFRLNGTYYSARLRSKQAYSPSIHKGEYFQVIYSKIEI